MTEPHAAGAPAPASAPGSAGAPAPAAPPEVAPSGGKPLQPERSGSRLGRSALFVHGLGVAFALVAAAVVCFAGMDFQSEDPFVLMAVGGGALIVCTLWSVVLAVRAACRRERLLLPAALGLIVWAEASACLVALWFLGFVRAREATYWPTAKALLDVAFDLALPVLLPVTLCAMLLAWPPAWWIVRRTEARRRARGADAWTPALRGRVRRRAFAACLVLLALLMLPVPAVLYCASVSSYDGSSNRNGYVYWGEVSPADKGHGMDWKAKLVCGAPAFVTHLAERVAAELPFGMTIRARGAIMRFQALGEERLEAVACDPADPFAPAAFISLQQANPERAAALARRVWSSSANWSSGQAGKYLVLLEAQAAKLLLDDLDALCVKSQASQIRRAAFRLLVESASKDRLRQIIERWARSPVAADRMYFYGSLSWLVNDSDLFFEYVFSGVDDKDPSVACEALRAMWIEMPADWMAKPAALRMVVARCVKLLEEGHPEVRRGAAELVLSTEILPQASEERRAIEMVPYLSPSAPVPPGWRPSPVYDRIRAAAEKWLKEHGE